MKVVCYDELELKDRYGVLSPRKLFELEEKALAGLGEYCRTERDMMDAKIALCRQLSYVLSPLQGVLDGKIILDLGCGSNDWRLDGFFFSPDKQFEPWLCRGLQVLGVTPIGIDYRGLGRENFRYYHANLADADCLAMIADHSVDVANASSLFDSPFLNLRLGLDPIVVKQNLILQLERVVKTEGTFLYSR